jgi:hypothetical protein
MNGQPEGPRERTLAAASRNDFNSARIGAEFAARGATLHWTFAANVRGFWREAVASPCRHSRRAVSIRSNSTLFGALTGGNGHGSTAEEPRPEPNDIKARVSDAFARGHAKDLLSGLADKIMAKARSGDRHRDEGNGSVNGDKADAAGEEDDLLAGLVKRTAKGSWCAVYSRSADAACRAEDR